MRHAWGVELLKKVDGNRVSQAPYTVINVSASWQPGVDSPRKVRVWGKNLTDEVYIQSAVITSGGDEVNHSPTRSIGIEYLLNF